MPSTPSLPKCTKGPKSAHKDGFISCLFFPVAKTNYYFWWADWSWPRVAKTVSSWLYYAVVRANISCTLEANSSYVVANVYHLERIQTLCGRPPPGAMSKNWFRKFNLYSCDQTSPSSVSLVNLAYQIAPFTNIVSFCLSWPYLNRCHYGWVKRNVLTPSNKIGQYVRSSYWVFTSIKTVIIMKQNCQMTISIIANYWNFEAVAFLTCLMVTLVKTLTNV